MRKKILVTGGAGFIGSHLCERLLKEENQIICLDNFYTGKKDNISDLMKNTNFKLLRRDVTLPINIEVDEIYNLACPASPIQYQIEPINTTKTSIIGMINMLELAKKNKARILQASTSEVYGDPEINPQKESYWGRVNPIGTRSCYDEGKRCAESLCFDYMRQHKVDIRIARIFNTYGSHMDLNDGRVVSNFIVQALTNKNITIYGDGLQSRSFQFIDDLIEGIIKMMENEENFTGPVNIGNPNEFTIKELSNIILEMIPESKSRIVYKKLPQDDPRQRRPNISLAKRKLNWEPKISLKEGLKKTIPWFKNAMSNSYSFSK